MTLRTKDCPDANGRSPRLGEQKWTLTFPLETGETLNLEVGKDCLTKMRAMINQMDEDDASGTYPSRN